MKNFLGNQKIRELEEGKRKICKEFDDLKEKLKITQELLAKEKIDNENSLLALRKMVSE